MYDHIKNVFLQCFINGFRYFSSVRGGQVGMKLEQTVHSSISELILVILLVHRAIQSESGKSPMIFLHTYQESNTSVLSQGQPTQDGSVYQN